MRIIKSVDERRQEILDGAVRLFSEKGYDKTSISDIAKYLGISQGLCYRYFKSKEEIFKSAIDEYANSIADEIIKIITSPNLTLEEKLSDKLNFHDLETKKSSYYKVFHEENAKLLHDSISISICRKVTPYIQAEIDKEIKNGRLEAVDSAMFASCFVYGQLGILLDTNISAEIRIRRISEFLTDMLERYKI
ncbi:TetR/AcrR family transcriptional regulator [Clostridiaceae bacterium UIB06]|nr:TetR/AcrR family transcriptional regulator [Clostridiaceae bacterium UIB06]